MSPRRYTVGPGREIHRDGVPFIGIERFQGGVLSPHAADQVTHLIASLLNASPQANAHVCDGPGTFEGCSVCQPALASVAFDLRIEDEDFPVRGNFASGDDALDKATEDEILDRLNRGDTWAWCHVIVTATAVVDGKVYKGRDSLGGCSYASEKDFKQPGGYYDDMKAQALEDLKRNIKEGRHV